MNSKFVDNKYVAGLFDGEGSVSICRIYRKAREKVYTYVRVDICNTFLPVLEIIRNKYGGSIHMKTRPTQKHKQCYGWCASGKIAERFCLTYKSLLSLRLDRLI